MGKVAATYTILPEDTAFDMEGLKERIPGMLPEGAQPYKAEVKPFAFGLKMLELIVVMDDANNVMEALEERLRSIEGIQSVENTGLTLI
ncbi:MAG TPA: elongation factor 1-beta [Methanomassiliicoccales archaeon]|nr:elongation factor 1-beta [Methanomassiliicoccales archaeon]